MRPSPLVAWLGLFIVSFSALLMICVFVLVLLPCGCLFARAVVVLILIRLGAVEKSSLVLEGAFLLFRPS